MDLGPPGRGLKAPPSKKVESLYVVLSKNPSENFDLLDLLDLRVKAYHIKIVIIV